MSEFIKYINTSQEMIKEVSDFLILWNDSSDFIETRTSGSTGSPTVIRLEKTKMVISAKKTLNYLKITEGKTAFLCLSPATIAGKMMIIRSLVGKLNLIVGPVNSNPLAQIDAQIDFVAMVPIQLENTLLADPEKLKNIENIIIGGGQVSQKVSSDVKRKNLSIYHTFGMTETISHIAMRKIGVDEEREFHALPGINFSINENRLLINYPEIGIERLETNDIVKLIDSETFEWIGRQDFVINSGGIKLIPEEIESKISDLFQNDFFVTGIEDERLGQKLVLIAEGSTSDKISKQSLGKRLDKKSIPKEIIYIPKFIRTTSGKINRIETLKLINEHVIKEIF